MNPTRRAFLQLPQGTESFYLEEAMDHEETVLTLRKLFSSWGYLPVQTPVLDFYDIYRPLLDPSAAENTYRLIDREGELLLLRSDVTLFLAKQMGRLSGQELPLRVCYADTILRHQDAGDISKNEFYQIGAELIGAPGTFADLEILTLLVSSLETAGLPDYRIHLGSRAVFRAAFPDMPDKTAGEALRAISLRDAGSLKEIVSAFGYGPDRAAYLAGLFLYIGGGEGLMDLLARGKSLGYMTEALEKSLTCLGVVWTQLEETGTAGVFRLDLSETASQPYYTGIVFQAYKEGIDSAFASGGRYDNLLSRFGFDAPSIGFSIMLRKIEGFLRNFQGPKRRDFEAARGATFAEAFRAAEAKRREGKTVIIEEAGA
jgi:ATP phosphoribosyltransferase regulatory subunit